MHKDVVYIHTHTHTRTHNGILLIHKKNDILTFAATYMDLEGTEEPGGLQSTGSQSQTGLSDEHFTFLSLS